MQMSVYESSPQNVSVLAFLHMMFGDFHIFPLRGVFQLHSLELQRLYFYAPQIKAPFILTVFFSLP